MFEEKNDSVAKMLANDAFSAWLGIKLLEIKQGKCVLEMVVTKTMLNGFGSLHGGISFALADSALAFAANAYGRLSVAIEAQISYPHAGNLGDKLTATATEMQLSNKLGIYQVIITNQLQKTIAIFKGTVYRTSKNVM